MWLDDSRLRPILSRNHRLDHLLECGKRSGDPWIVRRNQREGWIACLACYFLYQRRRQKRSLLIGETEWHIYSGSWRRPEARGSQRLDHGRVAQGLFNQAIEYIGHQLANSR